MSLAQHRLSCTEVSMLILKKIIIMTEYQNSNISGIVKFENFAGRTTCFVRILGLEDKGEICIKCGEDIMYMGNMIAGEMKFGALYDLTKPIYIAAAYDGKIVAMGSNTGRFSASLLNGYFYQYYADKQGAKKTIQEKSKEENSQNDKKETLKSDILESDVQAEREVSQNDINQNESIEAKIDIDEDNSKKAESIIKSDSIDKEQKTKKRTTAKVEEPFYKQIEASMLELFEKYESEEELNLLVPDSKWVRVPVDGQSFYVVGLIYSDGKPNLICYGVPDKDDSNPPENSNDCRQWLELEKGGRGYWMMYQSAISGQTLTTQII